MTRRPDGKRDDRAGKIWRLVLKNQHCSTVQGKDTLWKKRGRDPERFTEKRGSLARLNGEVFSGKELFFPYSSRQTLHEKNGIRVWVFRASLSSFLLRPSS